MRFEALAWSLLEIIAPALIRKARKEQAGVTQEWLELGAWVHDLLVPYLALILGSVSGRDAGLVNLPPQSWLPAGVVCLTGIAAAYLVLRRLPEPPIPNATPLEALRLEPRLALYRAAMATWLFDMTLAIAAGGLLAIIEWVLSNQPWRRENLAPRSWAQLLRIVFSGLIFWATRNLWLTAATQSAVVLLLSRMRGAKEAMPATELPDGGKESGPPARPHAADESE